MKLAQKRVRFLFQYDYRTGLLSWRNPTSNVCKFGEQAGWLSHGYWRIQVDGQEYPVHHIIWLWERGYLPKEIDHINRNRGDNRWQNLREVSHRENMYNLNLMRHNTSGTHGVCWAADRQKWRAYIGSGVRREYLGDYTEKDRAIAARELALDYLTETFHPLSKEELDALHSAGQT